MGTAALSQLQTLQAELKAWQETARQEARNAAYYRELLNTAAGHLGPDVFVADDGSVMDEPLRAKVPELVQRLKIGRDAAHEAANNSLEAQEQAEALVERLRAHIQVHTDGGFGSCRGCQELLADPTGARLARERIAELEPPTGVEWQASLEKAEAARLAEQQRALGEAIKPFLSGGEWGTWKAYMVHGPDTKEHGIAAAKQITAWQVALDTAVERARGGGDK